MDFPPSNIKVMAGELPIIIQHVRYAAWAGFTSDDDTFELKMKLPDGRLANITSRDTQKLAEELRGRFCQEKESFCVGFSSLDPHALPKSWSCYNGQHWNAKVLAAQWEQMPGVSDYPWEGAHCLECGKHIRASSAALYRGRCHDCHVAMLHKHAREHYENQM